MFNKIANIVATCAFWFICWPLAFRNYPAKKGEGRPLAQAVGCYVFGVWAIALLGIAGAISIYALATGAYKN